MFRALIGLARLPGALMHLVAGLGVATRLPSVDEAGRRARIGWFASTMLRRLGVSVETQGSFAEGPLLIVANHVSWLDILAVHAACPGARFVSKADVHRWPVVGWLAAVAGTLFIERERTRDSIRVVHEMAAALRRGQIVAVFPEGTTSDGHAMLPFHNGLLQAAITSAAPVQAVALRFSERGHAVSPSAAYVGELNLIQSVWRVLCAPALRVRISALAPLPAIKADRRVLAQQLRERIEGALRD